jgi:hypothetical protein
MVSPPPVIRIMSVLLAGVRHPMPANGAAELTLPDLPPPRNHVQIEFLSISYSPGEVLRYQYLLEGSGEGWSAPTENRSVCTRGWDRAHIAFWCRR